jgi:hypothetical protein
MSLLTSEAPDLGAILAYKGLWALCTTNKSGEVLKATHYASVIIGGPHPVWCVWTVRGKIQRYFGSRGQVERAYPNLVWRRKMATWALHDPTDKPAAVRRHELEDQGKLPENHDD